MPCTPQFSLRHATTYACTPSSIYRRKATNNKRKVSAVEAPPAVTGAGEPTPKALKVEEKVRAWRNEGVCRMG